MSTFEENPSVKTAVELETRRRKRVFPIFLVLLIVPVAIGLYAIAKAPSETDAVAKNVSPLVERNLEKNVEESVNRRVKQEIEPRVDEIVAQRASPIIQQTLDKQLDTQLSQRLDRAIVARVQPLEQQVRTFTAEGNPERLRMAARVKELEARIAALEKRLDAMSRRPPVTHVPVPR